MWLIVSVPVIDHDGVFVIVPTPPEAALPNVAAERVVTALALVVPAEPGSPVCSLISMCG